GRATRNPPTRLRIRGVWFRSRCHPTPRPFFMPHFPLTFRRSLPAFSLNSPKGLGGLPLRQARSGRRPHPAPPAPPGRPSGRRVEPTAARPLAHVYKGTPPLLRLGRSTI